MLALRPAGFRAGWRGAGPGCGAALTPTTAYSTVGPGWNTYDVLTSSGDLTKDGRPDLITRNPATGTLYLYKGISGGAFAPRVKVGDGWNTYKKIVGTGDLNGDGIGDLVAQDKTNNLYRYFGNGNGWQVYRGLFQRAGDGAGRGQRRGRANARRPVRRSPLRLPAPAVIRRSSVVDLRADLIHQQDATAAEIVDEALVYRPIAL